LPCGGDVEQHHFAAHALFQVDVLLQLQVGPEVDELDALVGRAKTVDAAEPLNDPDRIPVDVVVDDRVAVLEVLALAHAVRGDQKVDFAVSGEVFGTFLRAGGECRDDADKILAQVSAPWTTRSRIEGIERTRTFFPPSFGISFFRACMGRYVLVTNSSRICTRKLSAPLSSMASNVTPSMPGAPSLLLAIW